MEDSKGSLYRLKLVLRISILTLCIFLLALIVYENFRIAPRNVRFSNITSTSFTVSWDTKTASESSALIVEDKSIFPFSIIGIGKERFFDTRDIKKAELIATEKTSMNLDDSINVSFTNFETEIKVTDMGEYFTHHVQITNLEPEKKYKVMVGDKLLFTTVKDVNKTSIIETSQIPDSINSPIPAYGSIKDAKNTEVPLADLTAVTDAIIYFNYIEEISGEKSNVVSGSVNESGNWYIDISNLVDKDGNLFKEKYNSVPGANLLAEIQIDAGALGVWKKTINAVNLAPLESIVLNSPNTSNDPSNPETLVRIDKEISKNEDVKGTADGCVFITYCGCGKSVNGSWEDCACDEATLESRHCNSQQTAQEAVNAVSTTSSTCAGGGAPGSTVMYGTACKTCSISSNGSYYYWADTPGVCVGEQYTGGGIVAPAQDTPPTTQPTTGSQCIEEGALCDTNGICKSDAQGRILCFIGVDKDKDVIVMDNLTIRQKCLDVDGCDCLYGYENSKAENQLSVDYLGSCPVSPTSSPLICESTGGTLTSSGGCLCSTGTFVPTMGCKELVVVNPKTPGASCTTTGSTLQDNGKINNEGVCVKNAENGACMIGSVLGKYDSNGICKELPFCNGSWVRVGTQITCSKEGVVTIGASEKPVSTICWESNNQYINQIYYVGDNSTYQCENGSWNSTTANYFPNGCKDGAICTKAESYCVNSESKLTLRCLNYDGVMKLSSYIPSNENIVVAFNPTEISGGSKCNENYCLCKDGSDKNSIVTKDNYCVEYYSCFIEIGNIDREGKVCRRDGSKCVKNNCVASTITSNVEKDHEKVWGISNSVFAEGESSQYIIDPQTGLISNLIEGVYSFNYQGETYVFYIDEGNINNENLLIYIDLNNNGLYDEGTDKKVSDLASVINITSLEQRYEYKLEQGFNFVSIPYLIKNTESRTAAALLKKLNEVYGDVIYSIAKYDGTWKIVGQNVEIYDNNDFQLIPGQGYIIKAKKDIEISILGQPIQFESNSDNAPITLFEGWNLIGLYGSRVKLYTAKSLIKGINDYTKVDFNSDTVSEWESDTQKYEGYIYQNENGNELEYGFDFPINNLNSYFVRILKGRGNWNPEIR